MSGDDPHRLIDGRYVLGPVLGSGGTATVYAACDTVLDRPVAVKILHEQFAADTVFRTRFAREAKHAGNLSHPGVVTIFDAGIEDGVEDGNDSATAFIVMERVYGPTLREVLASRGRLAVDAAVAVAASVCDVLDAAHRAGIVHRDIKPANIVLADDGRVRVLDFGIAHTEGSDPLTQTATVMGTAAYLSPEQAAGQSAGPASDLYSLGCVLMEMLTGSPPFDAATAVAAMYRHVHEVPPRAADVRSEVPPGLDAVLDSLLAKQPSSRPATAALARAELLASMSGSATGSATDPTAGSATLSPTGSMTDSGRPTHLMPAVSPGWRAAAAVAAVAVLVAAGLVASGRGLPWQGPASGGASLDAGSATAHQLVTVPPVQSTPPAPTASASSSATSTLASTPAPALTVVGATSLSAALDAVRAVIAAGQAARVIVPGGAAALMDAVKEIARARDQRHGRAVPARIGGLAELVSTLTAQGLVVGDAVTALDQAVAQLYGWPPESAEA